MDDVPPNSWLEHEAKEKHKGLMSYNKIMALMLLKNIN